ncbi:MAG: SPOR domain-containing protein [Alistipes sp.]|nr:SPOR domain-containing protein [Alistipes sp.]
MKRLFFISALLLFCATSAQNLNSFKKRLANPVKVDSLTTIKSTVKVTEHGDAAELTAKAALRLKGVVNGYRIMIFMSNSQNARNDAMAARDTLKMRMPDQPTYITYENPYFKVTAGNCTSQEEALVLLEQIRRSFPKAFIMRENIPLEELAK